jgi:hypothetical protein
LTDQSNELTKKSKYSARWSQFNEKSTSTISNSPTTEKKECVNSMISDDTGVRETGFLSNIYSWIGNFFGSNHKDTSKYV